MEQLILGVRSGLDHVDGVTPNVEVPEGGGGLRGALFMSSRRVLLPAVHPQLLDYQVACCGTTVVSQIQFVLR